MNEASKRVIPYKIKMPKSIREIAAMTSKDVVSCLYGSKTPGKGRRGDWRYCMVEAANLIEHLTHMNKRLSAQLKTKRKKDKNEKHRHFPKN